MPQRAVRTPIGWITLTEAADTITALTWGKGGHDHTPLLRTAAEQLAAYFAHELQVFDLPLRPSGNAFQQSVNAAIRSIPYGETRTYGQIAQVLDAMPQPVGAACGGNSIAVIIPCHRVVATDGIGGYSGSGGVETKVALLKHEGAYGLLI
ncbi:MAG: methylated-DNA--[protein]-cysteine S-methyltransferase [Pseudomonadota bacterium]